MPAASLIVIFATIAVGVAVAVFLSLMAASPEAERERRFARSRDLARYRHHPDANLLSLND